MAKKRSTRLAIFISFVLCCISVTLLSISYGSKSWITSDCINTEYPSEGIAYFGLFSGQSSLTMLGLQKNTSYKVACVDHQCMYSRCETKDDREESVNCIINSTNCSPCSQNSKSKNNEKMAGNIFDNVDDVSTKKINFIPKRNSQNDDKAGIKINNYRLKNIFLFFHRQPIDDEVDGDAAAELMSQELWIATIALLSGALLFAVVGSIFAVINTATTPIEFVTGVPGLYIWNGLAAALGLACVICWGVQYSLHLTYNVLIEDSADGWTTEGLEHLGYSYWLVVGAVFIHLANCVLIAVGTYERKVKTQYEAPETKPGNIMLY